MKKSFFKKIIASALVFTTLISAAPYKTFAAENLGWVYFLKYGANSSELWRVKSDGSTQTPEKVSGNFDTSSDYEDYIVRGGNYFYYLKDTKSFFRIPSKYPEKGESSRIIVDNDNKVLNFRIVDDFVYYLSDKNKIMRFGVNAKNTGEIKSTAKEIVNMVDGNNPTFFIESGRIYFNALKDGRELWVASRAADGSGENTWICPGIIDHWSLAKKVDNNIYLMVNTSPKETKYSTECIVMYKAPIAGGAGVALSEKKLDLNSVHSGMWAGKYYMFNDGVTYSEKDLPKATSKIMDINGKINTLHEGYVFEVVNSDDKNKFVFVDGKKSYAVDVVDGAVKNKKDLGVDDAYYVRNLKTDGKIKTTALFGEKGTYVLNKDLAATKLVGVEWDMCLYRDDIDGIFYINAADEGKLYKITEDGTKKVKLTSDKILQILTIEPAK